MAAQAVAKVVEEVAKKATEKVVEKIAEKGAEKAAEKAVEKVAEKGAEGAVEKVAENAAEEGVGSIAENVAQNVATKAPTTEVTPEANFQDSADEVDLDTATEGANIEQPNTPTLQGENESVQESTRKDVQERHAEGSDSIKNQLGMDKDGTGKMADEAKDIKDEVDPFGKEIGNKLESTGDMAFAVASGTKKSAEEGKIDGVWEGFNRAGKGAFDTFVGDITKAVGGGKGGAFEKIAKKAGDMGVELNPAKKGLDDAVEGKYERDR